MQLQIEQMVAHDSHHLVSFHIVHIKDVQIVKTAVEWLADLEFEVYYAIKHA